jgi:hypothetical protein
VGKVPGEAWLPVKPPLTEVELEREQPPAEPARRGRAARSARGATAQQPLQPLEDDLKQPPWPTPAPTASAAERHGQERRRYPVASLRAGERASLEVQLASGDVPILFEPGPGAWPSWARLDNSTGALALAAPEVATREELNVTVVLLDAHTVDGLARRTIGAELTVQPAAAAQAVDASRLKNG